MIWKKKTQSVSGYTEKKLDKLEPLSFSTTTSCLTGFFFVFICSISGSEITTTVKSYDGNVSSLTDPIRNKSYGSECFWRSTFRPASP